MTARGPTEVERLPLGETLEFLRLIWGVDHALQKASKRIEASLGITGPQRMVIRIVGRFPGIPTGKLAEILHVHPSTLTGVVRRLQRQGLVSRWPDPRDQRRALLGLTPRGRALNVDQAGSVEDTVRRLLAEVPGHGLAEATRVLRRLTEMLDAPATPSTRAHGRRPGDGKRR